MGIDTVQTANLTLRYIRPRVRNHQSLIPCTATSLQYNCMAAASSQFCCYYFCLELKTELWYRVAVEQNGSRMFTPAIGGISRLLYRFIALSSTNRSWASSHC